MSIPWKHNLKLTLVEADKHPGNPVLRRGPSGSVDHGHAILYGTVIKTEGKFRMWYLAMYETEIVGGQAPGNWRPMCYAESDDGVNWVKPALGLVEFNGSKDNNICLIEGEPHSLTRVNDFLSVLYEPDEPDTSKRYKAVYIAHVPYDDIKGGMSNVGPKENTPCVTIAATSADGLRWKVVGDRPISAGGERFEVSSIYRFGGYYYSTGQILSPWAWLPNGDAVGRIMQVHRSRDFMNWSHAKADAFARAGQLTVPAKKGQQAHLGAGIWNRGNVLIGLYGIWQDGPLEKPEGVGHLWGTSVDLGLLISNDGIYYQEPVTDFKVISRGDPGEWDDVALLQGHAFVNHGDKTMIWYSHWDTGGKLKNMEIGLATLRRDGFGFLSRQFADNDAHFITSPINTLQDSKLRINVDSVTSDAPVIVELFDAVTGEPIAGYSGDDAALITQNGVSNEIIWPSHESGQLPKNSSVEIKVNFPEDCQAKLYALYLTK
ncbi:MAG: hypothetical protein EAS52_22900 [Parapedobacter sp.]|nr:MAG: hypothetical protein EAS52_22900 [Parapedobacter sp.]